MTRPLRVLFASSEVVPYAKTGGLADVAGALTAQLRQAGHEVVTVMPAYDSIDGLLPRPDWSGQVDLGERAVPWTALEDPETDTVFLQIADFFQRGAYYTDDPDEHLRWAAFDAAVLDLLRARGWQPDIVHCNDWQTGLIPALMRGLHRDEPYLQGARSVITIHNLGYQGRFDGRVAPELGLGGHEDLLHQDHLDQGYVSFLETGLLHADAITTVSPTYARELQTPEGGAGLDWLLRERARDVTGILNGIDPERWNPRTDRLIPFRYSEKSLWRKEKNKEALLDRHDLPYRKEVPVLGMVTRFAHQKGIDLLPGPLGHFLDHWDVRVVVLGSGEARHEAFFRDLAGEHPDKVGFTEGYDEALSHLIEAGSDIFLMPSLYEPCGLNQMYSLAYGTIPVVRRVGGLADTVDQADSTTGSGTGVVFDHYTEDGLGWAIGRALTIHMDKRGRQTIQRNGMAIDNSWSQRADRYTELYRSLLTSPLS